MTVGQRVFELLKQKGMTQKEFSERTGIATTTISDWRKKNTNPGSDKILLTQTSHIKNGLRTLKNQYFNPQNSNHAALCPYFNASCIYFGSL